jgi:hypothetical protein
MYNCSVCSFSSIRRRAWDRHYLRFGHALQQDDADMASLHDSFEGETPANPPGDSCEESQPHDPSPEEISSGNDLIDASPPHNDSEPEDKSEDEDSWFPWKSKAHFHLTVLYHGSHRRYYQ